MNDIDYTQEIWPVRKPMKLRRLGWTCMALWNVLEEANPGGKEDWREFPMQMRLMYIMILRDVLVQIGPDLNIMRSIPRKNPRYIVTENVIKQCEMSRNLILGWGFSQN